MDFLSCFNINVHNIPFPTHNSNHTLDLIITLSDENFVSNFFFNNPVVCDHFPVHCNLSIQLPLNPRIAVCYRKLQAINGKNNSEKVFGEFYSIIMQIVSYIFPFFFCTNMTVLSRECNQRISAFTVVRQLLSVSITTYYAPSITIVVRFCYYSIDRPLLILSTIIYYLIDSNIRLQFVVKVSSGLNPTFLNVFSQCIYRP